jgi:hypothetical protein
VLLYPLRYQEGSVDILFEVFIVALVGGYLFLFLRRGGGGG